MTQSRAPLIVAIVLLLLPVLLVLYVLSVGPASWLASNGYLSCTWLYYPLLALTQRSEQFDRFFWWYVDLWNW